MRARIAILVLLAMPLAGIDLFVKAVLPTNPYFFHQRSGTWMAASAFLLVIAVLLARLPSRLLAASAGLFAAGVLGNLVSAGMHHGLVPNPFVLYGRDEEIAFNLADLYVLAGILLLTASSLRVAVRYRHCLPQSTIAVRLIRRYRSNNA